MFCTIKLLKQYILMFSYINSTKPTIYIDNCTNKTTHNKVHRLTSTRKTKTDTGWSNGYLNQQQQQ